MLGTLLLIVQAFLYFAAMAGIFRLRHRLGLGVFVCALGVMHFLETYLAAVFFIRLPFGLLSPGSTVMFAGKLAMLLMLYIRADAETVRQPIYGLFLGNCLMVGLAAVLRAYSPIAMPGYNPDLQFLDQLGVLMVWGTILLFADSIGLILLYERLGRWLGNRLWLRAAIALAAILSCDQLLFYPGLHLITGAPLSALWGGWLAKVAAAILYGGLLAAYLRWIEPTTLGIDNVAVPDLFGKLTYRHRYEALVLQSGIDVLTGVADRRRFETIGQACIRDALVHRRPLSLAIIDVDHFKSINDRYGHLTGDDVLRRVAAALKSEVRSSDHIFRYGGEEFVILCIGMAHDTALAHAERLRRAVPAAFDGALDLTPTVSIGVATAPGDGVEIDALIHQADRQLYRAKQEGRDRVCGHPPAAPLSAAG